MSEPCTCTEWQAARFSGTDNESYGPLVSWVDDEWRMGCDLKPVYYCPWCGGDLIPPSLQYPARPPEPPPQDIDLKIISTHIPTKEEEEAQRIEDEKAGKEALDEWRLNMRIWSHTMAMRDPNPFKRFIARIKWGIFVGRYRYNKMKQQIKRTHEKDSDSSSVPSGT